MNIISKNKKLIFDMFLVPIVPVACVIFFVCINIFEVNTIAIFITLFLICLFVKLAQIMKRKHENVLNFVIVSIDWFLIDGFNMYTNNEFMYLKSSILETSLKLLVNTIVL